jgi:transposase
MNKKPVKLVETMTTYCYECDQVVEMQLPNHPAGLGRCTNCGFRADLSDNLPLEVRQYLACYDLDEG